MLSLKHFDLCIFIGALNIFVYSVGFLNIIAIFIFEINSDADNLQLNTDSRQESYLTLYRVLLLMYTLVMIITSINLIKGIIKKSTSLVTSWLVMSLFVVIYQVLFILDQTIFWMAYGYTIYSIPVLLGLCIIFVLQIMCLKKIFNFSLYLYSQDILQCEQITFVKNSNFKIQNYHRNLTQNDLSIMMPLNEEESKKLYTNCNSVNLNKFEI